MGEKPKSRRRSLIPVALLLSLVGAFWYWQTPGSELQPEEIENYLGRMGAGLSMDDEEKDQFIERLRMWAEEDDGRPVHMLNLIRFHEQMGAVPGHPGFTGTAEEANAHYERVVMPLLFSRGIYPVFASSAQGLGDATEGLSNLIGYGGELEGWDRVMLVRYPTRRAFLDLASDQAYLEVVPYKLAAIDLGFVPLEKHYMVPDLRWVAVLAALAFLIWRFGLRQANKEAGDSHESG